MKKKNTTMIIVKKLKQKKNSLKNGNLPMIIIMQNAKIRLNICRTLKRNLKFFVDLLLIILQTWKVRWIKL